MITLPRSLTGAAMFAAPLSLCLSLAAASVVASALSAAFTPMAAQVKPPMKAPAKTRFKLGVPDSSKTKAAKSPTDTAHVNTLPIDGVAAIVGDQVVLISEVTAETLRRRSAGAQVRTKEDLVRLESEVRDQLLEAELLVQKAKAEKI